MTAATARSLLVGVLGLAAALGAVAALLASGAGALAAPPARPVAWEAWAAERGPLVAAVAIVRVVALAAGGYAAGLAALSVIAAVRPAGPLVAVVRRAALPPLRPLLAAGLAIGPAAGSGVTAAYGDEPPSAVAEAGGGGGAQPPGPGVGATMRLLDDAPAPGTMAEAPPTARPAADATHATHVIAAGEHLWAVAEQAVARSLGRPPSDGEVAPYWRDLVERNRPRLANPSNPDLVFPGQVVELPPGPPAAAATP